MIIQCHPYNSCHVQQPFLEHSQGFIQFQCPSLFADDFIISLHELDISFDIFPRSKMMLTPLKINQQNLQKKKLWTNPPPFLGGFNKNENFPGLFPPPKTNKKKTTNWRIWRTPGALQRQIPTSSSITNQHGLWDLLGIFCGKGKVEEFMLKYVSLYIMINMYIYINIHVSCIYINDYKW